MSPQMKGLIFVLVCIVLVIIGIAARGGIH